jgi:threonine dehydrogenase-like Zn-dependent dehydrogenase
VLVEPLVVTTVLDEARGHSYVGGEGFRGGDTVVVQGAGPLGLLFVLRARLMGAGDIVVVDSAPYRLDLALQLGATHVLDLSSTSAAERVARVQELTGGRGGDVVIDCAGVPDALAEGLEMARKGGTYLETGAYVDTGTAEISPHRHLCSKSIRLIGSTNHPYTGYGPALKLLELHGERFAGLVSHRVPLEEVERAILTSLEPESAKVLVAP